MFFHLWLRTKLLSPGIKGKTASSCAFSGFITSCNSHKCAAHALYGRFIAQLEHDLRSTVDAFHSKTALCPHLSFLAIETCWTNGICGRKGTQKLLLHNFTRAMYRVPLKVHYKRCLRHNVTVISIRLKEANYRDRVVKKP